MKITGNNVKAHTGLRSVTEKWESPVRVISSEGKMRIDEFEGVVGTDAAGRDLMGSKEAVTFGEEFGWEVGGILWKTISP